MSRRGLALIAVLWVVTLLTGVLLVAADVLDVGQGATRNRVLLTRTRWAAEACLAIAQGRWAAQGSKSSDPIDLGRTTRCRYRYDNPAERINVNLASREMLAALFGSSMADQIVERRARRPFVSVEELIESQFLPLSIAPLISVEGDGRLSSNADPRILAALPGLTAESVNLLHRRREQRRPVASLEELAAQVSPASRAQLSDHRFQLAQGLMFDTTHLLLTATGWIEAAGAYPVATVELLVAPQPDRLAILRRRFS